MSKALYSKILIALVLCSAIVSAATFKETTDKALDNQVEGVFGQITAKIFQASDMSINNVVVMYALLIVTLIVLLEAMSLVPLFANKAIAFIATIVVTLLIAFSGAFAKSSEMLFAYASSLAGTLGDFLALVLVIATMTIIGFLLRGGIHFVSKKARNAQAKIEGFNLAKDIAIEKKYRESRGEE